MDIEEVLLGFFLMMLYLLPSIVAGLRHHHQGWSIVVINVFLGWTLIGWVVALSMSLSKVK